MSHTDPIVDLDQNRVRLASERASERDKVNSHTMCVHKYFVYIITTIIIILLLVPWASIAWTKSVVSLEYSCWPARDVIYLLLARQTNSQVEDTYRDLRSLNNLCNGSGR